MTTRPTGQLRSSRRARVALLALLVTAVGLSGRSAPTDATWHDRVRVAAATGTSAVCTETSASLFPATGTQRPWYETTAVFIHDLPLACVEGPHGLQQLTVIIRDDQGVEVARGTAPALDPSSGAGLMPQGVIHLDRRLDRRIEYSFQLVVGGWPVPSEDRALVLAVGGSSVWSSQDAGSTWDLVTDQLAGQAHAVASDGQGGWTIVGENPSGGPAIWYTYSWLLPTIIPLDLGLATDPVATMLASEPLYGVASNGSSWVAVGGSVRDEGATHTAAVWVASGSGSTFRPVPPSLIAGQSMMRSVATDGTRWVAVGASRHGLGTAWATTNPLGGPSGPGPWTCVSSHRSLDASRCPIGGPSASAEGVATNASGDWMAVGSSYADPGPGCPVAPAGAWKASGDVLTTWIGRRLNTSAGTPPCGLQPESGRSVAVGLPVGGPASGTWLAAGSYLSSGGNMAAIWRSTDSSTFNPVAYSFGDDARAVATNHRDVWLVGGSKMWRSAGNGGAGFLLVPDSGSMAVNGIAFDLRTPTK